MNPSRVTRRPSVVAHFAGRLGVEAILASRLSRGVARQKALVLERDSRAHLSARERAAASRQRQLNGLRDRREN